MQAVRGVRSAYIVVQRCSRSGLAASCQQVRHHGSHFPVDDTLFGLTEQQQQLRRTLFNFAQKELAPKAAEIDKKNIFLEKREFWKKLGALGAFGLAVDPAYGGAGLGCLELMLLHEELSRASAAVSISLAVHCLLCIGQIHQQGNEEQKKRLLPKLISGEHIGALAISEVNAGSDAMSMRLRAEKAGDHYILNGSKFWISNGADADVLIVYAKTEPAAAHHGITTFVVERGMEGFSSGPRLDLMGVRGSGSAELIFQDCKVPAQNILGEVNKGSHILLTGLDFERASMAAGPVGLMQAACDVAFEYVHTRKQFNRRIGEFQLMQGKMADMYCSLNASRSYMYAVGRAIDQGSMNTKDCAGALLFCGERAVDVCLEAVQCLGGNGYVNDYPTGRLLRDAKCYHIGGGTNEIRRLVIGRCLNSEYR